jgi:predicted ATPase/DNA-binding XRE family transcriptional regulator
METFGEWLQQQRDHRRLTREEFANRVGCSIAMLRKIEYGERRPSTQIAELIANAIEIPSLEFETFIRVARGELKVDRISHLSTLTPTSELASAPSAATSYKNLPILPTPFIGRDRELKELDQLLRDPDCRLLTLVGPGGIGKTRLAIETASQIHNEFPDGVVFVALAPVNSSRFIVPIIADSIGFAFQSDNHTEPKLQLLSFLKEKQMLLLVDNVEHLLKEPDIELFPELIASAPMVKLLFTSREPLDLQAEWVFEVHGLPVPEEPQAESTIQDTSIELFIQRARRAHAGFSVGAKDLSAIAHICQLVDGMPLGIELAAAWVRTLSCEEIAHEIEQGLDFLQATARDLPARHRSMRAVFNHTWKLLSEEEQSILCRLSVFQGGFSRKAAEQVAGATLSILSSLVTKSIIRRGSNDRYDLHEVIRQYAHEQLINSNILGETSDRHFEFFLALAETLHSKSIGIEQLEWLTLLDENLDNLRAALEWSLRFAGTETDMATPSTSRAAIGALRLTSMYYLYCKRRCHWTEGREWLELALKQSASLPGTSERADALNAAALLATEQADTYSAYRLAEENLELSKKLGDSYHVASALRTLGVVLWKQKNYVEARVRCQEGLALFRQMDDLFAVAETLHSLGHIAINQGDYETAQSYLDESLSISEELGSKIGIVEAIVDLGLLAYLQENIELAQTRLEDSLIRYREANLLPGTVTALNRLGDLARYLGDYEKAGVLYKEALSLYRGTGDLDEIPGILHNLGYIARHQGDHRRAMELFKEGLAIQHQMDNRAGIAECLLGIAGVLSTQGQAEEGARLFGAAEALRQGVGASLWPANRVEVDFILGHLRGLLSEENLKTALANGQAIPIEQIITEQLMRV